jgi:hypothetical protein
MGLLTLDSLDWAILASAKRSTFLSSAALALLAKLKRAAGDNSTNIPRERGLLTELLFEPLGLLHIEFSLSNNRQYEQQ